LSLGYLESGLLIFSFAFRALKASHV